MNEAIIAEARGAQLDCAITALAKIGFTPNRYPRPCPEQIARAAMLRLGELQEIIDRERNTGP